MNNSVLLDTSYLISLMDDTRTHHSKAKAFYQYFIENKFPMILSSIVTSEFTIKQSISDLPLNNLRPLPFNIPDSHHISSLFEEKFKGYTSGRVSVKDDYKIVSQCSFNKITYLITEDSDLCTLLNSLNSEGKSIVKPLFLPDGYEKALGLQASLF